MSFVEQLQRDLEDLGLWPEPGPQTHEFALLLLVMFLVVGVALRVLEGIDLLLTATWSH